MRSRLDTVEVGQNVKIIKLNTKGKLMHKLLDMGFVPDTVIQIVRVAPLNDPMELKIHNYHISLRKSEANLIEVEKI